MHKLRAAASVVMIGASTARVDDPSLLARTEPAPPRQPLRAVITTRFEVPFEGKLFADLDVSPLVIFGAQRSSPARQAILAGMGVRVEEAPARGAGVDVSAVLGRLAEIAPGPVLAEGGGGLAASLVTGDLVDRIEWFRAPILIGGDGKPALAGFNLTQLDQAPRWRRVAVRELGPDLWESYERV